MYPCISLSLWLPYLICIVCLAYVTIPFHDCSPLTLHSVFWLNLYPEWDQVFAVNGSCVKLQAKYKCKLSSIYVSRIVVYVSRRYAFINWITNNPRGSHGHSPKLGIRRFVQNLSCAGGIVGPSLRSFNNCTMVEFAFLSDSLEAVSYYGIYHGRVCMKAMAAIQFFLEILRAIGRYVLFRSLRVEFFIVLFSQAGAPYSTMPPMSSACLRLSVRANRHRRSVATGRPALPNSGHAVWESVFDWL